MNPKELAVAVMNGQPVEKLPFMPITMMFAADRINVPYRRYATEAALMARGQLKIAEEFGAAQISAISDPGVEAHDLGADIGFPENNPPYVNEENALFADKAALVGAKTIRPESGKRMSNRVEAVRLMAEAAENDRLVEGWVEGPCAEASDLRGINRLMTDFFDDPSFVADLMDFVTEQAILFARAQIRAGAQIVGIGDAASSLIGPDLYAEFSVPRTKRYINAIHDEGALVRLHICGRTEGLAPFWKELGADMIDVDAGNSIAAIREALGPNVSALAGNLDPVREVRDSLPSAIAKRLNACRKESAPRFIVGAGCEIPRDCPADNLMAMKHFADNLK
ncbi:MAG: uroporphyrinogen decarboxylase family protein [Spirochaetaceae bacterium]|nr:uroporphyrinogen decarboxylase family protein [Spirochaetaceae bacterium]MDT8297105.1 uroporphyrinogen decarboxylase family protein [Spirochaetaceae bacterium]